jgi:predicted DNA-binding WGR domain protein
MDPIYLERHDPEQNLHRFYQIHVVPGIIGNWSLVRELGRVSSPGAVRKEWFGSEGVAVAIGEKLGEAKLHVDLESKARKTVSVFWDGRGLECARRRA